MRRLLPERCQRALRVAWSEVAGEQAENVEFVMSGSPRWEVLWNARRFKSDWRA